MPNATLCNSVCCLVRWYIMREWPCTWVLNASMCEGQQPEGECLPGCWHSAGLPMRCCPSCSVPETRAVAAQVLTEENVRALRESVKTLTRTLEHVESISGDVGGLTGDGRVKANVRQLIEALSRITSD